MGGCFFSSQNFLPPYSLCSQGDKDLFKNFLRNFSSVPSCSDSYSKELDGFDINVKIAAITNDELVTCDPGYSLLSCGIKVRHCRAVVV